MKSIPFAFKAAAAGIVLAALILWLWPAGREHSPPAGPPADTPAVPSASPAKATGPVSYAAAVERVAESVVNIYTTRIVQQNRNSLRDSLLERFFGLRPRPENRKQSGLGSGVLFSDNGYVITNYHVVHKAQDIRVSLKDGRDLAAEFVGADPETDLAILHIDAEDLNGIPLGRSENLRVGDVVLAIGNPFGVGQTVTLGIISATGRDHLGLNTFENFIQTDAAINPGNSGGALVNAHGELIGINTAIFSRSGGNQGIGFAIPVDMAKTVLQEIVRHGKVIRGWLGVEARNPAPRLRRQLQLPDHGVIIVGVFRDGPADTAGLKRGDVLVEINGTPVTDSRTLLQLISDNKPDTQLAIRYWRDGETYDTTATLSQRPAPKFPEQ